MYTSGGKGDVFSQRLSALLCMYHTSVVEEVGAAPAMHCASPALEASQSCPLSTSKVLACLHILPCCQSDRIRCLATSHAQIS